MSGMWKFGWNSSAVGLDVDREQDEESPHGEEVRQPGDRPFEQAALPEDLGDLRPDSLAGFVGVPRGRLAGRDQLEQPQDPPGSERGHDHASCPCPLPV